MIKTHSKSSSGLLSFPELGYKIKGFVVREKNPSSSLQPQYTLAQFDDIIASGSIDRVFIPSADMVVNGYAHLKKKGRKPSDQT